MENFCSHGLDCCPMAKSFFFVTINLIVVLWICIYIFCHRLDCCLMVVSVPMDLVVALWRIPAPMDLVVVLWKNFCSHGLGCCPMENFVSVDLVVVLRKILFP
jgi:hypothetical protein